MKESIKDRITKSLLVAVKGLPHFSIYVKITQLYPNKLDSISESLIEILTKIGVIKK